MLRRLLPVIMVAGLAGLPVTLVSPASAHAEEKKAVLNIRGSVVNLAGSTLKVKTREGETVDVALADDWQVASVANAKVSDIKPGDYVGIASLPKEQGGDGALEVLIFPPALKGAGEGSFGWDLKPNSSMTNATVADAVKDVDGRTVTVSYHGKEKKISIPDGTPVVTIAPATKEDLVAGAVVFIPAEKASSGTVAHRVIVGKNGVVPPM
jgi:hypothetical protein